MATTGPPFDKPMPELREAFVRARFGQEDVFGRPDIEAWFARQRRAERPIEHIWRRLIDAKRVQRPFHIRELPDLAVPQELPRGFTIRQMADVGDPLVAMLCESVDRRRVDVLPVDERLTLFLLRGEDGAPAHAFTVTPQHNQKRRPGDPLAYTLFVPSDKDLLQVVLSRGWSVGPKKIATAARRLLCDGLEACIGEERGKAEADFDTAVAVSADGTKIVHADWVIVRGVREVEPSGRSRKRARDPEWVRVFRGAQFHGTKILRTSGMKHGKYSSAMDASAVFNRRIGLVLFGLNGTFGEHHKSAQLFGRVDEHSFFTGEALPSGKTETFLYTTADFCPSPLPRGGVEVTV